MIPDGSRYEQADRTFTRAHTYSAKRQTDLDDQGEPVIEVRDTLYRTVVLDTTTGSDDIPDEYMAREGDDMSVLAAELFGDSRRWWQLAEANPHIRYPLDLKMGDVLVVPE